MKIQLPKFTPGGPAVDQIRASPEDPKNPPKPPADLSAQEPRRAEADAFATDKNGFLSPKQKLQEMLNLCHENTAKAILVHVNEQGFLDIEKLTSQLKVSTAAIINFLYLFIECVKPFTEEVVPLASKKRKADINYNAMN